MKLHLSLKFLGSLITALLVSGAALGQEEEIQEPQEGMVEVQSSEPLVEVITRQDNLAPYRERREKHGGSFALGYEALLLSKYTSTLSNNTYKEVYGENPVPLIKLNIDYKYNADIGSAMAGLEFGKGSLTDDRIGESRTLDIMKIGANFKLLADVIWDEPYVVPYIGLSVWQMDIGEKSPTDNFSATTQLGYNYLLGLMFQLDWIDKDTAKNSTFNWGLENTFIDVYATQYAKTQAVDDANTETDFVFGAAFRMEF